MFHPASGQFFGLSRQERQSLVAGSTSQAKNTAIVKAGDLLFLLNDDATLIVAKANQTGFESLKRYTVADNATCAQPTISSNRVFIKDVSSLVLWSVN